MQFSFSLEQVPERQTSYDALPAGWYDVTIAGAEIKDSKSGGQYINVRYDITGPSAAGRVVFGMITVRNGNPKAEEIGMQQLGELIQALGFDKIEDTDQLIGGRLSIKLTVSESEQYGEQNRVGGYRALKSDKPAGASTNSPPWAKK